MLERRFILLRLALIINHYQIFPVNLMIYIVNMAAVYVIGQLYISYILEIFSLIILLSGWKRGIWMKNYVGQVYLFTIQSIIGIKFLIKN